MKIINKEANPSGSYFSPQDWAALAAVPEGMAVWPDTLDTADFYAHNGFVTLSIEQVEGVDTVTSYEPNTEAWEAWREAEASKPAPSPEPEPGKSLEDRVAALEADKADKSEVAAVWDQMAAAYAEGVQEA